MFPKLTEAALTAAWQSGFLWGAGTVAVIVLAALILRR